MLQVNKVGPVLSNKLKDVQFPVFRNIEWKDQDLIKEAIRDIKRPSSTFHFTCLMLYNDSLCEMSFLNNNLILKISNLSCEQEYYILCGFTKIVETIGQIFKYQKNKGLSQALHFIPEEIIQANSEIYQEYTIVEDRDYFDYVYALEDFKNYASSGHQHHAQRKYHYFEKHFPNSKVKIIDISNNENQLEIINEFKEWQVERHKDDPSIDNEFKALKKLFEIADKVKCCLLAVKDGDTLVGFEIHELINQGFILGHFCKILPEYTGAEEIILHKIAEEYLPQGYKYLNIQEDLGIEGLRKHKLNLHPTFFIKLYAIYPK